MVEKTREQLEDELRDERRKRELLEAAHVERQISDGRYSMKWVEKGAIALLYGIAVAVGLAILAGVVIPLKPFL